MSTYEYFNKWDKYDVEKELDKVDEEEKKQEREKSKASRSKQKASVEIGALGTAVADAEALEAQARVAALKASKPRRRRKVAGTKPADGVTMGPDETRVQELLERAEAAKKKSAALKSALDTRDTARDLLRGDDASPEEALRCAELALKTVIELEQSFPEFMETSDDIDAMNKVHPIFPPALSRARSFHEICPQLTRALSPFLCALPNPGVHGSMLRTVYNVPKAAPHAAADAKRTLQNRAYDPH